MIIANFVKNTDFDNKLNSLNKNVTSYKTKQVLLENGLTKDLINGHRILNGTKYFSSGKLFRIYNI